MSRANGPGDPVIRSYYRTQPPAPPLRALIECLWVHAVADADADGDRRILPDGRMDLVWIRGLGAVVAGPQSGSTRRPVAAPMLAFGARFRPGAAPALLRTPAIELLDDNIPLAAFAPRLAVRLEEALQAATDERSAFDALNRELVALLERVQPDPVVSGAVALLGQRSVTVKTVAQQVYVSERQLERRFVERVGYGPKTLHRILRLQRLIAQLESQAGAVELAGVAASAGYSDQPHLSRETRRLTGLTPKQLVGWLG